MDALLNAIVVAALILASALGLALYHPRTARCQGGCPGVGCLTNDPCGPLCQCDGARIEPDPRAEDPNSNAQTGPMIIFGECMRRFPDEFTPPSPPRAPSPEFPEGPQFDPAHPQPGPGDV